MSNPLIIPRAIALFAVAALAGSPACSSPFTLPPAGLATDTSTWTLWALTGTDLSHASAFDFSTPSPNVVRTDQNSVFDFAFDVRVDSLHDTTAVLLPRGALGLFVDGGLQVTTQPFDSITIAPTSGYQDTAAVVVRTGTVVLGASRSSTCNFGYIRPLYAKLNVLALDLVNRSITFKILHNPDCGYRSLKLDSLPPTE